MAKRESGIGTEIKWLEDKQLFCQRFGYKDKAGRNKVKALYGKSKGEVTEKRKAWQKELGSGVDMDSAKMTLGDWLNRWLDVYKKGTVEDTTCEMYKRYITTHIQGQPLGNIKLQDLNRTKLQAFITEKKAELSTASLKLIRAIISNSLKNAVEDNILIKNPAIGLKLPKKSNDEREDIKPFAKAELQKLLTELEGGKYYYIVYVAAFTGMRRGELLGLRWQDVDLKNKVIHVRQQAKYIETKKEMEIGRLKTDNAYRDIPINDNVVSALKKQKAWQAANKLKLGTSYIDNGLVFTDEAGAMITAYTVTNAFRYAIERAEVEYRSFHHLRHTFASIAISNVPNVKAISMILGHATISETMDTYGHLLPGDNQTVTAAVANFLAGL